MTDCICGHPKEEHDKVGCIYKNCPCLVPSEEIISDKDEVGETDVF